MSSEIHRTKDAEIYLAECHYIASSLADLEAAALRIGDGFLAYLIAVARLAAFEPDAHSQSAVPQDNQGRVS